MPRSPERLGAVDVVAVPRVAAVDDRVAGLEQRRQRATVSPTNAAGTIIHTCRGGGQRGDEVLERLAPRMPLGVERATARRSRRRRRTRAGRACSRRTMLAPIRPSPTMPICIGTGCHARGASVARSSSNRRSVVSARWPHPSSDLARPRPRHRHGDGRPSAAARRSRPPARRRPTRRGGTFGPARVGRSAT